MMIPLTEYLAIKGIQFPIVVFSTALTFGLIYLNVFLLLRKEIKKMAILLASVLTAVLFHFPQFAIEWLFFYPDQMGPISDSLLLFPNPIFAFLYYPIFRKILKFSPAYTFRALDCTVLSQYMIMVVYRAVSGACALVMTHEHTKKGMFHVDVAAMVVLWILSIAVTFVVWRYSIKRERYVELPYDYPVPGLLKGLMRAFLSLCSTYALLVAVNIFVLTNRRTEIDLLQAILYLVLILLVAYKINDVLRNRKLKILEWKAKATEEYISSLILAQESLHGVKHDFYNVLQVYSGYIALQDLDGLQKYHDSVVETTTTAGEDLALVESLQLRPAVYTLLNIKRQRARGAGLELHLNKIREIVNIGVNDLDLCRVLGNLLDNAIESAAQSREKEIFFKCEREANKKIHCVISNFTKENVDTEKIFQNGFTTKQGHRGQGLYAVRRILSSHDHCAIEAECSDNLFNVYLALPVGHRAS